ncbi:MAG TPA: hypothetical protein VEJ87_08245 [Acidimicrobiales bacterium]|nr:hypothetical protein [Acidimicrobiales bacterium]
MHGRPRLVILNGASCSGKTTIATAFRDQRAAVGDFWLSTGIDDYIAKVPAEWRAVGAEKGRFAANGVRFEATQEGMEVRVGCVGRRLFSAYQSGVVAAVRAGLNVIVDELVIDKRSWDDWTMAIGDLDHVWVGVRCSLKVLEERERTRPHQYAGLARGQAASVHRFARYDFELDTTAKTKGESLSDLVRQLGY